MAVRLPLSRLWNFYALEQSGYQWYKRYCENIKK